MLPEPVAADCSFSFRNTQFSRRKILLFHLVGIGQDICSKHKSTNVFVEGFLHGLETAKGLNEGFFLIFACLNFAKEGSELCTTFHALAENAVMHESPGFSVEKVDLAVVAAILHVRIDSDQILQGDRHLAVHGLYSRDRRTYIN